jgi:hypothetical protein
LTGSPIFKVYRKGKGVEVEKKREKKGKERRKRGDSK